MKKWKKILIGLGSILLILIIGVFIYIGNYYKADSNISEKIANGVSINTKEDKYIELKIQGEQSDIGYIFYPGGKVEEYAYVPFMSKIAKDGVTVYIVSMPANLAVLDKNKGEKVIEDHPEIKHWVIGGHSLGGAMATEFVKNHKDKIEGLILYGAYPLDKNDMSSFNIRVASMWGSSDMVVNKDKLNSTKKNLPKDTVFHEIYGGNHGNFGNYGNQKGDGEATITKEQQQEECAKISLEIIKNTKSK